MGQSKPINDATRTARLPSQTGDQPAQGKTPGFTLIELLTVIAIVGILSAIIISAVGAARASGQSAKCVGNLRQLGTAYALWAVDTKGVVKSRDHSDWINTIYILL
jgi:prepilin-type N-terminal cleavage/methylation domain-containing protein